MQNYNAELKCDDLTSLNPCDISEQPRPHYLFPECPSNTPQASLSEICSECPTNNARMAMTEHEKDIAEFGKNDDFWLFGYGYVSRLLSSSFYIGTLSLCMSSTAQSIREAVI